MINKIKKDSLTPIEKHGGIYFKREDYFKPFIFSKVNGGKLRQGISLVENNIDLIKKLHDSTLITATSVHSPQGYIISCIARQYNLNSIICVGAIKKEHIKNHSLLVKCQENGSEVRIVSGTGVTNVMFSKCKKISLTEGGFVIRFGINYKDNLGILLTIAEQVKNIPDNLHTLIIPCGSGLTMAGILIGINKYEKNIHDIYGIGVGPDRSEIINKILYENNIKTPYNFISLFTERGYEYSKLFYENYDGVLLDPIYEAKSFRYANTNGLINGDTLFWIVGNSNEYR